MPSEPIQKNEIFQYRKENSFYMSMVFLFITVFMIVVFKASYTDVSILVIFHLSFLLTHGVLNETVIVSNNNIIIKYNVLCFNTTTKKLWQEITHVKQYNHKGKIKLRLNLLDENSKDLSNNYIELSEPNNEGKMYDFICLCSAIKSQASSHNISIDDQKSTEKSSLFKKVYLMLLWLV